MIIKVLKTMIDVVLLWSCLLGTEKNWLLLL